MTSTKEAIDFFRQYWAEYPANDQEEFVVACLDTKHRVQCVVVITIGTLDASLVHPREVFKPAMIEGSSAIVLSHNHPSGNPDPSHEDRQVTERLTEAGKLIGINVLDHIIHGDGTGNAISIRECD
ncbi:JAB domain-containing protein [Rhodopirellula europaea]|uniref:JAB domain-containing protein n=1 Tax=Rhodopirellula europaea TaxID=1263866 RepID=UPI003C6DEEA8